MCATCFTSLSACSANSPAKATRCGGNIAVEDVYPVGRLDRDSEGLLLLTGDGELQHHLSDPKFQHPRTYWVQVESVPDERALRRLSAGVAIQGQRTRPALVHFLPDDPALPPRTPPIRYRKTVPTS